jgi:hypothetical protein
MPCPVLRITGNGSMKNARWMETLGYFNIQLGYTLKMGTDIGFKLVH